MVISKNFNRLFWGTVINDIKVNLKLYLYRLWYNYIVRIYRGYRTNPYAPITSINFRA